MEQRSDALSSDELSKHAARPSDAPGRLASTAIPGGAPFTNVGGLVQTNRLPEALAASAPVVASSLDPLIFGGPDRTWTLTFSSADNAGMDRDSVLEVVLALDYRYSPDSPN
jgi:hypothetical protein